MSSLIPFPDWVPPWAQLLLLIVGILLGLAFLLMPFSVFGVKSRLEAVEARLDEIQGEIRSLALRLPEPGRRASYDDEPVLRAAPPQERMVRPPIPPSVWAPEDMPPRRAPVGEPDVSRPRLEPKIGRAR